MMKIFISILFLFSVINMAGCSIESEFDENSDQFQSFEGPTISAAKHNCPYQEGSNNADDPCGDHCHGHCHCHCHCQFLIVEPGVLNLELIPSGQAISVEMLYTDPHTNNLFRPPIV